MHKQDDVQIEMSLDAIVRDAYAFLNGIWDQNQHRIEGEAR